MKAKYRDVIPQLEGGFFIADGGIETTLIFLEGQDLPYFAAFDLFKSASGAELLKKYFRTYADLAKRLKTGLILETATWRANPDWAAKIEYDGRSLAEANKAAVRLISEIREEFESPESPIVISGCLGPRGDGYVPGKAMSIPEAEEYHRAQIECFASEEADLVSAITMNYVEEAVGVAQAAKKAGMPAVIAFTVETDGRLPTGQRLDEAIEQVDDVTGGYPAYFMINCAHPTHFQEMLSQMKPTVIDRIQGVRANASRMSHAELDEATELDAGDPVELGQYYADLRTQYLPKLNVMGGCCGTDHRHIEAIAAACRPLFQ